MSGAPVYLDHNATTPVLPAVLDAMLPYLREHFGNASSSHGYGQAAAAGLQKAREQVASLLGAQPEEIVFTGGGTEASNLAIVGVLQALRDRGSGRRHIVTSTVEHPATSAPCAWLESEGWAEVSYVPVDGYGCVDAEAAIAALREDTALATIMHANNETGSLQPISKIAAAARERGVLVHTDAAQSLGKIETRVDALGVDLLTIAGHKLYAPKGVGALYRRRGTPVAPVLRGAGHEGGLRPGTENVAYAAGLGAACELASAHLSDEAARVQGLRDQLHDTLREAIPDLALAGHPEARLPNTLNLLFPSVDGRALLAATPQIAASTGSACHEDGESPSGVLGAMGLSFAQARGAVRLSLGRGTDAGAIATASHALIDSWRALSAIPC